jgi:nicotinamidase-related amidase
MKTALVVIDVQEYSLNRYTKDIPRKIARFIERGRGFDEVVFFKFENEEGSNWVKIVKWGGMMKPAETEMASELRKFEREGNVFVKRAAFSVFRVEEFRRFIKNKGISKLLICGLDTDACIYVATMEAFERGFNVKVIEDLCAASHGEEYHENAIKALRRNLGRGVVVRSRDILGGGSGKGLVAFGNIRLCGGI